MASWVSWVVEHWEFATGTALGIAGILVGIGIAFLQRQSKTLDYDVRNVIRLLSPAAQTAAKGLSQPITVYYGTDKQTDPYLFTIRVMNTGRKAIAKTDFARAIAIHCTERQPFDGFVSRAHPADLKVTDDGTVFPDAGEMRPLKPDLMNPGDWFELQMLTNGNPGEITASARFNDQSRRMRNTSGPIRGLFIGKRLTIATIAFTIGYFAVATEINAIQVFGILAFIVAMGYIGSLYAGLLRLASDRIDRRIDRNIAGD